MRDLLPASLRSRMSLCVLAAVGVLAVAWVNAQGWSKAQYLVLGLTVAALALIRLAWGFAALTLFFLLEVLSLGHPVASPARVSGLVLALISYPAIVWRLRQDGWTRARPSWWTLFLAAFLLYGGATLIVAVDVGAWADTFGRYVLFAGLALVGYACVQTGRDLQVVVWAAFLGLFSIAVFGLVQYAFHLCVPGIHVWRYYGAIRSTSTTVRPHSFAFMLVVGLGYAAALAYSSSSWRARAFAFLGIPVMFAALVTTMVRSSILLGSGVLAICYAVRFRPKTRWQGFAFLIAGIGLAVVIAISLPAPIRTRILAALSRSEQSVFARSNTMRTGLEIALHNPLGTGLGNAPRHYDLYRAGDDPGYRLSSHNTYLMLAGSVGWVGLLLFLLVIWATHLRLRAAESVFRNRGHFANERLLAGLRFILYAFLAQAFFWHQIFTDKLFWMSLGIMHAGAAIAASHWRQSTG